ncbi:hypothetical protein [Paludisphaera soli]|uniref:hypothetical protein n=1 Tax=Paludisphaera soli TaxID=2712865 RepID=UPI0013ED5481|nr:hypothetical protein [Paludisphaera soli]
MIAQILATRRANAPESYREPVEEPTRGLELAARVVQIALAIALLPALAAMLVVGGVGAAAYGLSTVVARAAGWEGGPDPNGSPEEFQTP